MALVINWYLIVIQTLHQTHDTNWYASSKNVNQTQKTLHVYEHILSTRFFQKRKIGKKLKIEKKIWNFKPKKIENGGGGGGGGYIKKKKKKKKK